MTEKPVPMRTITDVQISGGDAVVGVCLKYMGRTWNKAYRLKAGTSLEEFEERVAKDAEALLGFTPIIARIGKTKKIRYDDTVKLIEEHARTDNT